MSSTLQAKDFVPAYPGGTHIHFYFNIFTADQVGIGGEANRRSYGEYTPFTGYAAADRPEGATQLCAVVANPTTRSSSTAAAAITLPGLPTRRDHRDHPGRRGPLCRPNSSPHGFTPQYPGGTHIHFYFNTFTADQVGIGGEANRRSYGSVPPFTGYAAADRPQGATQLCAVVANPDHTVIPNSGNCFHLPDVLDVEITGITVDSHNRYVVEYVTYGFTSHWPGIARPLLFRHGQAGGSGQEGRLDQLLARWQLALFRLFHGRPAAGGHSAMRHRRPARQHGGPRQPPLLRAAHSVQHGRKEEVNDQSF